MVEFAWENQGNWSCRCPLGSEDPPVYSNAVGYWDEPGEAFRRLGNRSNIFLITLCLQEAAMSAPCLVQPVNVAVAADLFVDHLEALWLDGRYVWEVPSHGFYRVPGQDILVMDYAGLWIASHAEIPHALLRDGVSLDRIT
jgi:hypothetical protein